MNKALSSLIIVAALAMPMAANAQCTCQATAAKPTVVGTLKSGTSAVVKRVKGTVSKALGGLKHAGQNLLNTVKEAGEDSVDTVQFIITG